MSTYTVLQDPASASASCVPSGGSVFSAFRVYCKGNSEVAVYFESPKQMADFAREMMKGAKELHKAKKRLEAVNGKA